MTKMWTQANEWQAYALCGNDPRFVKAPEDLAPADEQDVVRTCFYCKVRPECLKQAVDNRDSGIWSASVWIPEVSIDDSARRARHVLEQAAEVREKLRLSIPGELERRGEF